MPLQELTVKINLKTLSLMIDLPPPIVSFITPHRNYSDLLPVLFNSLRVFLTRNCEWVIVDDCSDDIHWNTVSDFFDSVKDNYPVKLERLNQNRGAPVARNLGFLKAKGFRVAFIDSDDFYRCSDPLDFLFKCSRHDDIVIADNRSFDCSKVSSDSAKLDEQDVQSFLKFPLEWTVNRPIFHHSCFFYRRDFMASVGLWHPDLKANQDGEFLWRVFTKAQGLLDARCVCAFYTFERIDSRRITNASSYSKLMSRFDSLFLFFTFSPNRTISVKLLFLILKRAVRDFRMYRFDLILSSFLLFLVLAKLNLLFLCGCLERAFSPTA